MPTVVNGIDPGRAAVSEDFFAQHLREVAEPIDPRTDKELLSDAYNHSDPAVREHAVFEYIYRNEHAAFGIVLKIFENEEDQAVKTSLFEELSQLDRPGFKNYLEQQGVSKELEPWALAPLLVR